MHVPSEVLTDGFSWAMMYASRQRAVREGRGREATMNEKAFDDIMETIALGLNGDSEHDIAYLQEQSEVR